jgi:hypothetical protein
MKVRVRIQRPARFRILLLKDSEIMQSSPLSESWKVRVKKSEYSALRDSGFCSFLKDSEVMQSSPKARYH